MGYRLPASWMQAADDRILEYLRAEGVTTPKSLSDESPYDYHRNTVQRRLRLLSKAGLVERVGRGVYTISEEGEAYLDGELDLRDAEEPE